MPPHGYVSSPVCSCTCCEAPTQGTYTIIPFTPVHLNNCRQLHRGPHGAHKTFLPIHRHQGTDVHTHPNTHHTNQTLANPEQRDTGIDFCSNCTYLKIFILRSHLHIHLHWEFHMDVNPNTDPQILLHMPNPGQQFV